MGAPTSTHACPFSWPLSGAVRATSAICSPCRESVRDGAADSSGPAWMTATKGSCRSISLRRTSDLIASAGRLWVDSRWVATDRGRWVRVAALWSGEAKSRSLLSVITYVCMATMAKANQRASEAREDSRWAAFDSAVIGARVKALREASSLSLRDLAERSGVSAPMLSQVERGETSPTLTVAARIAAGLDLRLSQLLRLDEGGSVTIVRARERGGGGNAKRGHSFEVLTAAQPGQRSELSRHTLSPGGATGALDDPP